MPENHYTIEIHPTLPVALARLPELAENLMYSWERRIRGLFHFMDPGLWVACGHNPKVFLRRMAQPRLDQLATDADFLREYHEVLERFDRYLARSRVFPGAEALGVNHETVAYFCMEYGLYESLRLYSGGLGVLAGDYCKAASDTGLPLVAVGLMYRLGYFTQTIDAAGEQEAHYQPADLRDLPVHPARDASGAPVKVAVRLANRSVAVQVWELAVGQLRLLLLDTDIADNSAQDRAITYQLYGGDSDTRLAQEIVLGIGGVRALRALGVQPAVWHINEGHAAFLILERCREALAAGLDFAAALELTAAATVFTTHTPVAAGHDRFTREQMRTHFEQLAGELHIPFEQLVALGATPDNGDRFNMTALALRGSRRHNGVSRVHRQVAARMEGYVWPQIPPAENPMDCVNNGVHAGTFMARRWIERLDQQHPDWREHVTEKDYWRKVLEAIPDAQFWELRHRLKCDMLASIRGLLQRHYERIGIGRPRAEQLLAGLQDSGADTLVIGFARRFATYKRALLLFQDPQRLARLLGDPARPAIVLFAGKAHPQDRPGQEIIRELYRHTRQAEFAGKVFFLEGHGLALERQLVSGVDLWLNTPTYPQEASGTSGQKAAMNGAINLSVLDGWWEEGYDGSNGWAVPAHDPALAAESRDRLEAEELLDILEHEVLPLYYRRDAAGLPAEWIGVSRHSMQSVLPRYNARRMIMDYLNRFYLPALRHSQGLAEHAAAGARVLAEWKSRVRERWPRVRAEWQTPPPATLRMSEQLALAVRVDLNGLSPADLRVEARVENADHRTLATAPFTAEAAEGERVLYRLDLKPAASGLTHLGVRLYPTHPLLAHPFEMGCMLWL